MNPRLRYAIYIKGIMSTLLNLNKPPIYSHGISILIVKYEDVCGSPLIGEPTELFISGLTIRWNIEPQWGDIQGETLEELVESTINDFRVNWWLIKCWGTSCTQNIFFGVTKPSFEPLFGSFFKKPKTV